METAIFFESVEEIYRRIYHSLNPRSSVRQFSVRFRRYANANSRIRLEHDKLSVDISDVLQEAPAPIQEALATLLVSKLLRKQPDQSSLVCYQRYINSTKVQYALRAAKRERGRKALRDAEGQYFNLNAVFNDLNARYFSGNLRRPMIGWSLRSSRSTLGHYDPAHDTVVISRLLDSAMSSYLIVSYVMFHELLHTIHPAEARTSRRCVHTEAFKEAEKQFENYKEARTAIKLLIELKNR